MEFDLDRFDRDRTEFITGVRCATERLMDTVKMGPSELQLRELVMVCARLGSSRDLQKLAPVDWSTADWSRELRAGRTLIHKCMAVAKAAGFLEGKLGELTLNRFAVRLWLNGELPTVEMRAEIDRAKESQASKSSRMTRNCPPRGQEEKSATRTNQSASRTPQSASRIRTYISNNSNNSVPVPDASTSPPGGLTGSPSDGAPDPTTNAETGPVILESLPDYVIQQPEIADAVDQPVDRLDAGDLIRGVFTQLRPADLADCKAMTLWFRRQLAAPEPIIAIPTEAHLLIVIACGLYAARMPDHSVRRSRVGVFVSTICRQDFRRVLKYLPTARKNLDDLVAAVGNRTLRIEHHRADSISHST
ncbi:hypothetical protein [Roseiconus lacunae]